MFGHIAQMPQILRLAGFSDAVVWRGVPSQVTTNGFAWVAPDGSEVRAEYLPVGYGNGAALPDDAKALVRRTRDNVAEVDDFVSGDLLCMNGSDHLMPQPGARPRGGRGQRSPGRIRVRGHVVVPVFVEGPA